jgi:polyisoprenoid-binding protein YceI
MLRILFSAALAGGVLLSGATMAQTAQKEIGRAPTGVYELDAAHSQILFGISHIGLTDYHGRFDKLSGTLNLDASQPEKSATTITIDTGSVDTPSAELNDILKGSSVFATNQFPTATFKSTSVVRTGPDTGKITGQLTIRGVTKPVTLDVVFNGGQTDPLKGIFDVGFSAKTTIKRSDFGLTGMIWGSFVGDEVTLEIEALFGQEKE